MHCSVDFKLKSQTFNFELETLVLFLEAHKDCFYYLGDNPLKLVTA